MSLGAENLAEFTTSAPIGAESAGLDVFNELFKAAGGDQTAVYATTSYDATFLLALAVEEAGAADRSKISEALRSEEHTSELQSLMRISYAVFCLKKKNIER